jgi:hypothetical protein
MQIFDAGFGHRSGKQLAAKNIEGNNYARSGQLSMPNHVSNALNGA